MREQTHVQARKFLQELFNDDELTTFCFDYFPQVYTFPNLYRAFLAARKGKRDRAAVAAFECDLEHNLIALADE